MITQRDKVIFVQFSQRIVAPDNPALKYSRRMWDNTPGYPTYEATEHFAEVPTWIPIIWGKLPNVDKELLIVDKLDFHKNYYPYLVHSMWAVKHTGGKLYVLMSVMDANLDLVSQFVEATPNGVHQILSGYVDPDTLEVLSYNRVDWVNQVKDLHEYFPTFNPTGAPDYSAFAGLKGVTLPRITLSTGCAFECDFCTIPRRVVARSKNDVWSQVVSLILSPLYFEYIYVDDKTFGQSPNWPWLAWIRDMIRSHRPEFVGFVVQTTATYANKYWETWYNELSVQVIEIGVEVPDDKFLAQMKKPHRMAHIKQFTETMRHTRKHARPLFVPNLIFGFPNQNYDTTIRWVDANRDVIEFFNHYILALYSDQKGLVEGTDREVTLEVNDANENDPNRSWLYPSEIQALQDTMQKLYGRF